MTVAVITGAAGGIGAGLARECARRGMKVVLADRDATTLEEVARGIGDAALAVPADVTDPASVEALADAAYAAHGQVDLLFNNAGIMTMGRSWEIAPEKWEDSWKVNVGGVLNGLRAFVPRMLNANRPARIVNTASIGGFLPSPLMSPYSATKFAIVGLTEALAGELKQMKSLIEVSLLSPGPVKSDIFREDPGEGSRTLREAMLAMLDANGLTPDEFAHLVFEAIEAGQYWIFPQPERFDARFRARNALIDQRLPPVFHGLEGN